MLTRSRGSPFDLLGTKTIPHDGNNMTSQDCHEFKTVELTMPVWYTHKEHGTERCSITHYDWRCDPSGSAARALWTMFVGTLIKTPLKHVWSLPCSQGTCLGR